MVLFGGEKRRRTGDIVQAMPDKRWSSEFRATKISVKRRPISKSRLSPWAKSIETPAANARVFAAARSHPSQH